MFNIAEVLKYEGDNETFIWKHPSEDFNNRTQLIVHAHLLRSNPIIWTP